MPKRTASSTRTTSANKRFNRDLDRATAADRRRQKAADDAMQRARRVELSRMRAAAVMNRRLDQAARDVRRSDQRAERSMSDLLHALASKWNMHVLPRSQRQAELVELGDLRARVGALELELADYKRVFGGGEPQPPDAGAPSVDGEGAPLEHQTV